MFFPISTGTGASAQSQLEHRENKMTSLHTSLTAKGQVLSATLNGPALFTIGYNPQTNDPWTLLDENSRVTRWFKTREGAEFYALHLQAEAE